MKLSKFSGLGVPVSLSMHKLGASVSSVDAISGRPLGTNFLSGRRIGSLRFSVSTNLVGHIVSFILSIKFKILNTKNLKTLFECSYSLEQKKILNFNVMFKYSIIICGRFVVATSRDPVPPQTASLLSPDDLKTSNP